MLPPRPPCRVDRRRTASAAHREAADHVDRHHPLQACLVDLVDTRPAIDDSGAVHEHRQRPELANRLVKQSLDLLLLADVRPDRDCGSARRSDLGHEDVRGPIVLYVEHRDRVAARGGQPRGRRPDPAATAGDEHYSRHS